VPVRLSRVPHAVCDHGSMNRLLPGGAVLGLALVGAAAVLFALSQPRWAAALFALGALGVMAYLVLTARACLRELRTVKSNLASGRTRQDALTGAHAASHASLLRETRDEVQAQARALSAHVDHAVEAVEDRLRGAAHGLQRGIADLAEDTTRLLDAPALPAWLDLMDHRREGVCCLVAGQHDAASVQALDEVPARIEVWQPGPHGIGAPRTPAHAVGALLVDLDLVAGLAADHAGLRAFLSWLRPDVPIAGFTRTPQMLALRSAHLCRIADGMLLPVQVSARGMRFDRSTRIPGVRESEDPATAASKEQP
jgi:hypothetical protein